MLWRDREPILWQKSLRLKAREVCLALFSLCWCKIKQGKVETSDVPRCERSLFVTPSEEDALQADWHPPIWTMLRHWRLGFQREPPSINLMLTEGEVPPHKLYLPLYFRGDHLSRVGVDLNISIPRPIASCLSPTFSSPCSRGVYPGPYLGYATPLCACTIVSGIAGQLAVLHNETFFNESLRLCQMLPGALRTYCDSIVQTLEPIFTDRLANILSFLINILTLNTVLQA
ncbi:unnamed protein product [Timema podura]|uniref:Uncharacterized protein n=1 Tax=Timema podura TaxID=61482 RepID=A0ABN7PHJ5_TIMPD|nr:unnamed protein product [Timema podura]